MSSIIIILAVVAASMGIFSTGGPGPYDLETVTVYGKGLYKHMSQESLFGLISIGCTILIFNYIKEPDYEYA
ncbi:hypothetical protein [Halalkalibaculum sp. DA384]|uniref:hypothetical protein n=1 Tax=Halalkalibaculum sp. DA384 TaxID=3373606 RepID=UPI00375408BE